MKDVQYCHYCHNLECECYDVTNEFYIMDKSYLIKTDGTQEQVIPENDNDFSLEELNKFVGGYIEIVTLKNNKFMVVNEEGKLNGLPYNDTATKLFVHTFPGTTDYIVGDVLVCHESLIE